MKKIFTLIAAAMTAFSAFAADGVKLTFTGVSDASITDNVPSGITVNVADLSTNAAVEGVTAELTKVSFNRFQTGGICSSTNTLAPANGSGYGNRNGDNIVYTFKLTGLNGVLPRFNQVDLGIAGINSQGGYQTNRTNEAGFTFDVAYGATDAFGSSLDQATGDLRTAVKSGDDYQMIAVTSEGQQTVPEGDMYIQVTLTKRTGDGCFAGLRELDIKTTDQVTVEWSFKFAGSDDPFTTIEKTYSRSADNTYAFGSGDTYAFTTVTAEPATVAEGETVGKGTVVLTMNAPFELSADFANAKWYYLRNGNKDTSKGANVNQPFLYYDEAQTAKIPASDSVNVDDKDAYMWAIIGNPIDGYQFVNKKAGEGKYVVAASTAEAPHIGNTAETPAWTLGDQGEQNGEKCFSVTLAGHSNTETASWNYQNGIGWWHANNDAGSKWFFQEIKNDTVPADTSKVSKTVSVTWNYKLNGSEEPFKTVKKTYNRNDSNRYAFGEDFGTYAFTTITADTVAVSKEDTTGVGTIAVTVNAPFQLSADYDNATWYCLRSGNDDDRNPANIIKKPYLYYDPNQSDFIPASDTIETQKVDYEWAIMGNPIDGYQFINRGAEKGNYVVAASTSEKPHMGNAPQTLGWTINDEGEFNGEKCFSVTLAGHSKTDNSSWNLQKGIGWYMVDNGGKWFVQTPPEDQTDAINAAETAKVAKNALRYNLAGQRVSDNYKGVVIVNGKKLLQK